MPKITFKQSEVEALFDNEKVIVVDDNTRRVTKNDILSKTGLNGDFDVEIIPDEPDQSY